MNLKNQIISNAPKRSYQICKRCVMDTSDKWIIFDNEGICNHCKDYLENRIKKLVSREENNNNLEILFDKIKKKRKKNTKHDVVVGISGGVDSTMTAYLAQKAGLRVLAVHMDNCWDTPIASHNINQLISLPGIDYHAEVMDWSDFKKSQRMMIESGLPDIELPTDSALNIVIPKIAVKYNVRTILSGGNIQNEGILPLSWMYNPKDSLFVNSIIKKSGLPLSSFSQVRFGMRHDIYYRFYHVIKTIYPLNMIKYDKKQAEEVLKEELNWKSPPMKHSESFFTCFCQQIYQPRRHGMDYRRAHLSQDICLKKISRNKALEELKKHPWSKLDVNSNLAFIAYKLDYTVEELKNLMCQPPRWYCDYPNREKAIGYIYNFYRLLRGKPLANNFWG